LAQELDDRPVGKARLVVMAARNQHHTAGGPNPRGQLAGQTRLADPCLTLDDRDRPVRRGCGMRVDQRLHFGVATHERKLGGGWHVSGFGVRGRLNILRGCRERSVVDLLEELRGLREWRHAQLVTHDAYT
jgi:hypothetical protein